MKTIRLYLPILLLLLFISSLCHAQDRYELNTDWYCQPIDDTQADGHALSNPSYPLTGWMPATVPGTVLTTLLNNGKVPDPFYGMNNEKIKDIYDTGREYYTYWFVKEFEEDDIS